jgi:hypothetical protein
VIFRHLAEAEDAQLASATLPALERQYRLRFERGHAALLGGDIGNAVQHWEISANYFHFLDKKLEAEKRYEYCTRLREYGYRYRSVQALRAAEIGLEKNLAIWSKDDDSEHWCRTVNALGATSWRLSQFDIPANFLTHIGKAKSFYETVRENFTETEQPYYHAAAGINLASIYSDREFARSEEEYYSHLEHSLHLQHSALKLVSRTDKPVDWGIFQHNMGCSYTKFFLLQVDKNLSIALIDKAVHHLELSFQVRDPIDMLQYWIASCRSLGEALIERSMYRSGLEANKDLQRSQDLLSRAASKISETEHPNQWAEIQKQLERCAKQRLRLGF